MSDNEVAVVILNWNGRRWLENFLPNVIRNSGEADIWVIDNASDDDSVEYLRKNFPGVGVLQNSENYGFAGGYNAGLAKISAKYYVLLNSDVAVEEGWLVSLKGFLENNPNVAAIQPKLRDYYRPEYFEYAGAAGGFIDMLGYPFCRGRIFDTLETDEGQYDVARPVFWATGACFFVRSKVFWEAEGLDERFFAHMEEIDLCWRIQRLGYEIYALPQVSAYHVGGATLPKSNPGKTFLNFRNNLMMLSKNLPAYHFWWVIPGRLLLDAVSGLSFLLKGQKGDFLAIIKAHWAFFSQISYVFGLRSQSGHFPGFAQLKGVCTVSIVWQYFIRRKRVFSDTCHEE